MSLCVDITKTLGGFALAMRADFPDAPTAVIGASGSGKSLLLRCIAGIETPDSGCIALGENIWYDGGARRCLPPQRRRAGYLFQQYALFETMTVEQNIQMGMRGTKQEKRRACRAMMERFQLTALAGLRPAQLSGGQKQRTALARMLGAQPEVLLFDEPFSALDTHLRGEVRRQMADVLARHAGVSLLVTHDFSEVVQLCPRAVVVSGGRIVEQGACMQLWRAPRTRACAELTGMRNFFPLPDGMRRAHGGACCLGIRPEDFRPARAGDAVRFSGAVERILPGVYADQAVVRTAQGVLFWSVPHAADRPPQVGEQAVLSADSDRLHILKLDKT